MDYEAVLFDCDGVLVTLPAQRTMQEAARRTFARFDLSSPSRAAVRELLSGDVRAITARCRELEIDRREFCATAAREAVRAQCQEVEAGLRSVYDDVAAVRSLPAPLGIVSDNHRRVLSYLLERFDLSHHFRTVRGCSFSPTGFERRKPNPYNLEAALADLDVDPAAALYVGDRPVDIEAARRAGVDSALLCRAGSGENDAGSAESTKSEGAVADPGSSFEGIQPTHRIEGLRDLHAIAAVV